ncbi:hypothetical protein UT5_12030 [Ferrigenium sp. UT5]
MMKCSRLLITAVALFATFSLNVEAKLYKWVDSNGTTHYGETIPPEYASKEAVKLEKGRIHQRDEDRSKQGQKQAIRDPEAEKNRIEAERHDNALLNTYSSEKEIDLARDRNLRQVEARTNSFSVLLRSARENLASLQQEAENATKQGRKVFKSLEDDIVEATAHIAQLEKDLNQSLKETEAVKARYAADKARYRELKGLPPAVQ